MPLKAKGRVRDVMLAERPEVGRVVQRASSLAARGPPGVFDRWFPFFPISHMQISAPAPERRSGYSGGEVRKRRRLRSAVRRGFAYGDPHSLIFPLYLHYVFYLPKVFSCAARPLPHSV